MKYRCRGPVAGHYSKKEAEAMKKPDLAGMQKRKGCGHDLSALIAKIPADGAEHEIKCPKCGNTAKISKTPETVEAD